MSALANGLRGSKRGGGDRSIGDGVAGGRQHQHHGRKNAPTDVETTPEENIKLFNKTASSPHPRQNKSNAAGVANGKNISNPNGNRSIVSSLEPDLRKKFGDQLSLAKEMFPDWTVDDLLSAIIDANGDLSVAAGRISDGKASQWESASKSKKVKPSQTAQTSTWSTPSSVPTGRGGRGRGEASRGGRGGRGGSRGGLARGGPPRQSTNNGPSIVSSAVNGSTPSAWNSSETPVDSNAGGGGWGGWGSQQPPSNEAVANDGEKEPVASAWGAPSAKESKGSAWGAPNVKEPKGSAWAAPAHVEPSVAQTKESDSSAGAASWGEEPSVPAMQGWGAPAPPAKPAAAAEPVKAPSKTIPAGGKMSWAQIARPAEPSKPAPPVEAVKSVPPPDRQDSAPKIMIPEVSQIAEETRVSEIEAAPSAVQPQVQPQVQRDPWASTPAAAGASWNISASSEPPSQPLGIGEGWAETVLASEPIESYSAADAKLPTSGSTNKVDKASVLPPPGIDPAGPIDVDDSAVQTGQAVHEKAQVSLPSGGGPPGLNKRPNRQGKQDAPVVMPLGDRSTASVGVQFGSLSLFDGSKGQQQQQAQQQVEHLQVQDHTQQSVAQQEPQKRQDSYAAQTSAEQALPPSSRTPSHGDHHQGQIQQPNQSMQERLPGQTLQMQSLYGAPFAAYGSGAQQQQQQQQQQQLPASTQPYPEASNYSSASQASPYASLSQDQLGLYFQQHNTASAAPAQATPQAPASNYGAGQTDYNHFYGQVSANPQQTDQHRTMGYYDGYGQQPAQQQQQAFLSRGSDELPKASSQTQTGSQNQQGQSQQQGGIPPVQAAPQPQHGYPGMMPYAGYYGYYGQPNPAYGYQTAPSPYQYGMQQPYPFQGPRGYGAQPPQRQQQPNVGGYQQNTSSPYFQQPSQSNTVPGFGAQHGSGGQQVPREATSQASYKDATFGF